MGIGSLDQAVRILGKPEGDHAAALRYLKGAGVMEAERAKVCALIEGCLEPFGTRLLALEALGSVGEKAMVEALKDPDWIVRRDVCKALGRCGIAYCLTSLREAAGGDKVRFVREDAEKAYQAVMARIPSKP